jgi:hypothetical protein
MAVLTHNLRGTGESFALNIRDELLGASAALVTTQLANVMPAGGTATRLAIRLALSRSWPIRCHWSGVSGYANQNTLNCLTKISAGRG